MPETTRVQPIGHLVQEVLNSHGYASYVQYASPVVEALEARERDLADQLLLYADDNGVEPQAVRQVMEQIGMNVPVEEEPEEPARTDGADADVLARLADAMVTLTQRVDQLTEVARSRGLL